MIPVAHQVIGMPCCSRLGQVKIIGPSVGQVRILVADDFSQWRSVVRTILQDRPEWRIVCEASNGEDAVRKAVEHEPDIALLDIGMPIMNGFEAAKIIQQVSPGCRVIFLTQNHDIEIAQSAVRMGVTAYVLKANAFTDLPVAISAVLDRTMFVSAPVAFAPA